MCRFSDLSIIEIINLIGVGISSYTTCKVQVPSDNIEEKTYIPPENINSQKSLNLLEQWTKNKKMKLNFRKSKYMTFNFTKNYQFSTRLKLPIQTDLQIVPYLICRDYSTVKCEL